MERTHEHQARALLAAAIQSNGLTFAPEDTDRLILELARYLAEGQAMSSTVPAHLEPQTVVAFMRPGDET